MLQMQRTEGKTDQTKVLKEFLRAGDAGTNVPILYIISDDSYGHSIKHCTHLELVCAPRRNKLSPKNIKTLYLLATLKRPVKGSGEYIREINYLEKTL